MTLRIGMIGCGHIGAVHATALHELAQASLIDARLTAVYDPEPGRVATFERRYGVHGASSAEAVLDAVDVVWICTWTSGHRPLVEAAASRGVAVFCEKPLGTDLADCEAVAAALDRVPHQVGLVLRSAPVLVELAQRLASGEYGRVLTTVFRDDQFFPTQGYYGSTWRREVEHAGGGTLIEHSIHDIDILRWLLGEPESVSARTNHAYGHSGIDDLATLTLAYADGSTAQLISIWHQVLSRGSSRRLEVFCDSAYLWTESDHTGPLHIETSDGEEVWMGEAPPWSAGLGVPELYQKALAQYALPSKRFLDTLAAGAPGPSGPTAADALAAHRIVDAAYRSAGAGGMPVSL